MKRITLLAVLLLVSSYTVNASVVTISFEDFQIPSNSAWGLNFPSNIGTTSQSYDSYGNITTEIAYTIGGATFHVQNAHDSFYDYDYWSGIGLSTKMDTTDKSYTNDLASVTGSGYNSQTYAILYGSSTAGLDPSDPLLPYITLSSDITLQSFAVANTAYVDNVLKNGGSPASPLGANGYFHLKIYGLVDGTLFETVTVDLGSLNGWAEVNLSSLTGSDTLRFAFDGSDVGDWGLNTPAYFAFDDFKYSIQDDISTPEPATLLIFGLGVAGLALRRRK